MGSNRCYPPTYPSPPMSRVCKLLLLFGLLSGACRQSPPFDIIIKNGTVYDGTGTAPVRADIGISGDKITAAGDLAAAKAGTVIEAEGLAVAPGFVDLHVHLEPISELSSAGRGELYFKRGGSPICQRVGSKGLIRLGVASGGWRWPQARFAQWPRRNRESLRGSPHRGTSS